jgi:hypothetical protein
MLISKSSFLNLTKSKIGIIRIWEKRRTEGVRLNTQPTTLRQGDLNGEEKNARQPIQIMEWLGLK